MNRGTNRLADETSPYLRQHADNPVDWYPWGDEAFAAARERRPADPAVGRLLGLPLVPRHGARVVRGRRDRGADERAVRQRQGRPRGAARRRRDLHGGRPGHDRPRRLADDRVPHARRPPVLRRHLLPAGRRAAACSRSPTCAGASTTLWRTRRDDVDAQAGQLTGALGRTALLEPGDASCPGAEALDGALPGTCASSTTTARGGFGGAPKFPQAMSLDAAAARRCARDRLGAIDAVRRWSRPRSTPWPSGGIYDHLGGGFARYSVDAAWLVPHFEKMLYDQALLARVYLHAWQVTGDDRYRQVLDETIGYVLRDLRHPDGGFYSAEDADSEGEEGQFYVWTPDEVRRRARRRRRPGRRGRGVVRRDRRAATSRAAPSSTASPTRGDLDCARPRIEDAAPAPVRRPASERVRPGLDDKVLTEWNALMLAALAEAAAATGRRRLAGRGRRQRRVPAARAAARRRALAAVVAGRRQPAAPATSPTPPTTPRWSTRSPGWPRRPARPAGSTRPARPPTPCSTCSGTTSGAACSPPAATPSGSSPATRT